MRAKFINEGANKFRGDESEYKAQEIESAVYTTYNGDDVDYEPREEDQEELEELLSPFIKEGQDVEDFGDMEWILDNFSDEEIDEIHDALVGAGLILGDKEPEDVTDDLESDEMDDIDNEYDD